MLKVRDDYSKPCFPQECVASDDEFEQFRARSFSGGFLPFKKPNKADAEAVRRRAAATEEDNTIHTRHDAEEQTTTTSRANRGPHCDFLASGNELGDDDDNDDAGQRKSAAQKLIHKITRKIQGKNASKDYLSEEKTTAPYFGYDEGVHGLVYYRPRNADDRRHSEQLDHCVGFVNSGRYEKKRSASHAEVAASCLNRRSSKATATSDRKGSACGRLENHHDIVSQRRSAKHVVLSPSPPDRYENSYRYQQGVVSSSRHGCSSSSDTLEETGDAPAGTMVVSEWTLGEMRPRLLSLPAWAHTRIQHDSTAAEQRLERVRSFTITRKGLRKDFVERRRTSSSCSCEAVADGESRRSSSGSPTSEHSDSRSLDSQHLIRILGMQGVGKSTIISHFLNDSDAIETIDDDSDKSVSILLDGEESTLEFVDMSDREVDKNVTADHIDAYVVVYSVEDRKSFQQAIDRLYEIRQQEGRHVALILVANKTDLVRSRQVMEHEGRAAAKTYDSKYIEVSAAIDHKIDELLVGILKQIRLIQEKRQKRKARSNRNRCGDDAFDPCCLQRARANVLAKIFKGERPKVKSCDNLYVL